MESENAHICGDPSGACDGECMEKAMTESERSNYYQKLMRTWRQSALAATASAEAAEKKLAELEMSPAEIAAYTEWQEKDGPKCATFQPSTEGHREPTYTTTIPRWKTMKAEAAGLRRALDTARVEVGWIIRNSEPSGTESGDLSTERAARSCQAGIAAALSATSDQHERRIKAEALREAAAKVVEFGNAPLSLAYAHFLDAEADRLEKEAENGNT